MISSIALRNDHPFSSRFSDDESPFLAKCFIVTFVGKFRSDEVLGFHIDVKISDGVSTMPVRIADSACRDFLGFSAPKLLAWKRDKEKHRDRFMAASKRLIEFNQMLMHVNGVFQLEKLPPSAKNAENLEAQVVEMRRFELEDFLRLQRDVAWAKGK